VLVAMGISLASLVSRYRQASHERRRQMGLLAATAAVVLAIDLAGSLIIGNKATAGDHLAACAWADGPAGALFGTLLPMILYVGLPLAVAVAVLRHNLFEIDRLIRRSAVYATLCAVIAVVYIGLHWLVGLAVTDRLPVTVGILVTIVATVIFQPARRGLERVADRWVFGNRPSAYELASGFGAGAAASTRAGDLPDLARQLVEIVRRGLDVRWARVSFDLPDETARAESGTPADGEGPTVSVAMVHGDRRVGTIDCGPPLDRRLRPEDHQLLDLLAQETALAVHNVALAREVAASRARIVEAQDAERRRLERDIHDGAQQDLVAMILKVRLARDLVGRNPAEAVRALDDLARDARSALAGIREVAQGIHPSLLTDQGLVAAIEDRTDRVPLEVDVRADRDIRAIRLPRRRRRRRLLRRLRSARQCDETRWGDPSLGGAEPARRRAGGQRRRRRPGLRPRPGHGSGPV
jgi:signal transduction histidine kinase